MIMIEKFNFSKMPYTMFGAGESGKLPGLVKNYKGAVLVLTGSISLKKSGVSERIERAFKELSIPLFNASVSGEPSPDLIDDIVYRYRSEKISCVVSIGGGSVVDAGKAVSAMYGKNDSVKDYLEGVGTKKPDGRKVPFIAVPTTAGTGSEATKNAVISNVAEKGFKKSLRHDNYVPEVALIDPELTMSCSPEITAACGMDAFTQLLESYVSTKASPMTDALALSGLKRIRDSLERCVRDGSDIKARTDMSYASFISGITLANAGLGVVHGFASPLGAFFRVPHGVVCGTLLGVATRVSIEKLRNSDSVSIGLKKYADAGRVFSGDSGRNDNYYCDFLVNCIDKLNDDLELPLLGKYGVIRKDFDRIIESTGLKNNPVSLGQEDLIRILQERT